MLAADKDIILLEPYHIKEKLLSFNKNVPLPGIALPERLDCLVSQTMDSIQRINRITEIRNTVHSKPDNKDFKPLIAASYSLQHGNIDEAFWLVFLATHFGEEEISKEWNHVRNVYHALGNEPIGLGKRQVLILLVSAGGFNLIKKYCSKMAGLVTTENLNRYWMSIQAKPSLLI